MDGAAAPKAPKAKTAKATKVIQPPTTTMQTFVFKRDKGANLPRLDQWLQPEYTGIGDGIIIDEINGQDDILNLAKPIPVNLPKNARKDFPNYFYDYESLLELKRTMNGAKSLMDPLQKEWRHFQEFQRMYRGYDILKGKRGILVQKYGAEVVTNAWLKMYEVARYITPVWDQAMRSKSKDANARVTSLHIAEAPGNFIVSLNHYLQMEQRRLSWDWLANTYRDPLVKDQKVKVWQVDSNKSKTQPQSSSKDETGYLGDTYGLIAKYPDRWLFGSDCDGDITSANNIRSLQATIAARGWKDGRTDLVTSDVKYVPEGNPQYEDEELINRAVQTGHFAATWATLRVGGTAVLKEFSHLESSSVAQLYMATLSFDEVEVCKPHTSKGPNSETYLVLRGYRGVTEEQQQALLNYMTYIRFMNYQRAMGCPSILPKTWIPAKFVAQVESMQKVLVDDQVVELKQMMAAYDEYKRGKYDVASSEKASLKMSEEWIRTMEMKPLPKELRILSDQ